MIIIYIEIVDCNMILCIYILCYKVLMKALILLNRKNTQKSCFIWLKKLNNTYISLNKLILNKLVILRIDIKNVTFFTSDTRLSV